MQFNLSDIVVLLILAIIAFQFWRVRGITERANVYLKQYCEQQGLQLISVARHKTRLTIHRGKLDWLSEFMFEFSGNGEDASIGTLTMKGWQVTDTELPPYKIN